jgi:hypothetical protein
VLILDSGLTQERADYSLLNAVDSVGEPQSGLQQRRRPTFME